MSSLRFIGRQRTIAQVFSFTVTADDAATTYEVTSGGGQIVSVAGSGTGAANTAAALQAALAACTDPEFTEVIWTVVSATITGTVATAGNPVSFTTSVSGGAGTIGSPSNTQASVSPSDVNDALNYDTGSLPVSTNDLYFDSAATVAALWNLQSLSGITLNSLTFKNSFTFDCGLPPINTAAYPEWRPIYFKIGATTVNVGDPSGYGIGSGRINLDNSNIQAAVTVYNSGASEDVNAPAFVWKGTHASNTFTVIAGTAGAAIYGGEVATIATLTVNGGSMVCGPGVTLTTVVQSGGTLDTASAMTTCTQYDGTHTHRAGNVTTLNLYGGTFDLQAGITITTLLVGPNATLDLTNCPAALSLSTVTFQGGATIIDPQSRIPTGVAISFPQGVGSVNWTRGGSNSVTLS